MADDDLHAIELGVYGGYDAASEAIFAAFTTPPSETRKGQINTCVVALKAAGVWTKPDALYVLAAADSQAAKINWVNPGTYNLTEVNAPAFTADRGFTGASTKYLDTGFNPTTASLPKFTANDATIFGHANADATTDSGIIGNPRANTLSSALGLIPHHTNGNSYYILNEANIPSLATGAAAAFHLATRRSSTASEYYRNGTSVSTSSAASSGAAYNDKIYILTSAGQFYTGQVATAGFGSQLSAAEQLALYNAMRTYMTGVGVP